MHGVQGVLGVRLSERRLLLVVLHPAAGLNLSSDSFAEGTKCTPSSSGSLAALPPHIPMMRFGCRADCGRDPTNEDVVVRIQATFYNARLNTAEMNALADAASWNLCRTNSAGGEECWFQESVHFDSLESVSLVDVSIPAGAWYINVYDDWYQAVRGNIYKITNETDAEELASSPTFNISNCVQ
ncbi:hypothetical protein CYMTET_28734, partial [Cymbomonas tetramitiformis]